MFSIVRFTRLIALVMRVSSALLVLAGVNLLIASWLFWTRHRPFWSLCWGVSGVAFIACGTVSLLDLARRLAEPAMEILRPFLKLGAVALAIAGVAWAVQTEDRWERTGDFEAYGMAIGAIMAVYGVAAFWWWERREGLARAAGAPE